MLPTLIFNTCPASILVAVLVSPMRVSHCRQQFNLKFNAKFVRRRVPRIHMMMMMMTQQTTLHYSPFVVSSFRRSLHAN